MRCDVGCFVVLAVILTAPLCAQQITVQLPSFSSFGVNTTVVVPDRGSASLGGSTRMATGANDVNGIPRQRAIGLGRQTGGQQVMAQIHEPREADAALLGQASGPRAAGKDRAGRVATTPPRSTAPRASGDPALQSVAELEQRRAESRSKGVREAYAAFEKGRRAQAAGKHSVAAVYYRTAARQADGKLRQEIDAQLRWLATHAAPSGNGRSAAATTK